MDILGSRNVYFQPPANVQMQYPAIVYKRERIQTRFAGNVPYTTDKAYQVQYIAQAPDTDIPDKIAALPKSRHLSQFVSGSLNHDNFRLYF